jgi:hypothetical protein
MRKYKDLYIYTLILFILSKYVLAHGEINRYVLDLTACNSESRENGLDLMGF